MTAGGPGLRGGCAPTGTVGAMAAPFAVRMAVRAYEVDRQGHLNQAVYAQYAEHARWECLRAAGVTADDLVSRGLGPALVRTTVRYQRELGAGDEVDVGCTFSWSDGRFVDVHQDFRLTDGTRAASLVGTFGLLDLVSRRLVKDPRERFRALASDPLLLGLAEA